MADRIIKADSGNDVVVQNNGGTRKIEVTNSGDVEVTGDFKATTVKATNLKANDGTASLVVADSTGEVTSSGGLKATNVKTTNLKANDGTASLEIADSTGDIGFSGNTNLKFKLPSAGGIHESDGSTEILTESSGAVSLKNTVIDSSVTMSANQSAVKTALNASGSAPIYACRAWVNFDGTSGSGTGSSDITIRGSGNVTSVTDNGTGEYTLNFTTSMPDINYAVCVSGRGADDNRYTGIDDVMTTSSVKVYGHYHADGSYQDMQIMCVSIFR